MNATIERPMEGEVYKPSRMLDPTRFKYLWDLSERMCKSSLVPESLRKEGSGTNKTLLPPETILANVFAVVEQADRWDISPFALIQGASIVHGKLCFEGKIIAGVLEARLGIRLNYRYNNQTGDALGVTVFAKRPGDEEPVEINGTVGQWKTTGTGTPWGNPLNHPRQLAYRGAREWTRIHEPAIMLGVFSDDEMMAIAYEGAAQAATLVPSLGDRLRASEATTANQGFSATGVQQALEDKRQVPMETIKPRERELVDREETKVAETKADVTSGQRAAQPADSAASAPKADAGAAGSPQTAGPPQESPEPNKGEVSPGESGGADQAAVGNPATIRALLSKYNETLARATQDKSLKALATKFWEGNGGWPPANDGLKNRASRIYAVREELLKIGTPANEEQKTLVRNLNDDLKEALAE